jgi:agmatinase
MRRSMGSSFDPGAAAHPAAGLFGLPSTADEAAVHVHGVPFDATTSFRRGAAGGPAAILAASHQVDLFDLRNGRPYEAGIWMAPLDERVTRWNDEARAAADPVLAAGGVGHDAGVGEHARRVGAIQEELNAWVEARTAEVLDAGRLPVLVGGDHSVPFGAIRACAERHPGVGLLHVDAHADLRPAYEGFTWSHASILHNVTTRIEDVGRVLQVGVRDLSEEEHATISASGGRIHTVFGHEWASVRLSGCDLHDVVRTALAVLPKEVYVTLDVDGLDPALCPNTGTPVPGGLRWDEAMLWLEELARSGRRVVGLDLNEVAPAPAGEPGAGWDEIVGARLLYRLIGFALASRG